jgi:DNA-binding NtrC family response regulator
MITAYGTINNAVDAMKEGASDYILKPFSSEILESAVKKVHTQLARRPSGNGSGLMQPALADAKQFVTADARVLKVLDIAKNIAPSKATVLIRGESGTGKELLAAYIHEQSSSQESPYIAINCAALPESLAESELFGHEKGSFTGAVRKKIGKFEQANQGTLVLDEISEMPLHLQAKLLRVLQEKEIDPVGGSRVVPVDTRVIAISNIDLKKAVEAGRFREDLYYRLNVIPLIIPPLRERKSDIPELSQYFLNKFNTRYGKKMTQIADDTLDLFLKYDWRGNVRELENTIERAVLLGSGQVLLPRHLFLEESVEGNGAGLPLTVGVSLKDMERELIFKTLAEVGDNRTQAAKILGISIRTLRNKLREYREQDELMN